LLLETWIIVHNQARTLRGKRSVTRGEIGLQSGLRAISLLLDRLTWQESGIHLGWLKSKISRDINDKL
jgi:hypothetical protein